MATLDDIMKKHNLPVRQQPQNTTTDFRKLEEISKTQPVPVYTPAAESIGSKAKRIAGVGLTGAIVGSADLVNQANRYVMPTLSIYESALKELTGYDVQQERQALMQLLEAKGKEISGARGTLGEDIAYGIGKETPGIIASYGAVGAASKAPKVAKWLTGAGKWYETGRRGVAAGAVYTPLSNDNPTARDYIENMALFGVGDVAFMGAAHGLGKGIKAMKGARGSKYELPGDIPETMDFIGDIPSAGEQTNYAPWVRDDLISQFNQQKEQNIKQAMTQPRDVFAGMRDQVALPPYAQAMERQAANKPNYAPWVKEDLIHQANAERLANMPKALTQERDPFAGMRADHNPYYAVDLIENNNYIKKQIPRYDELINDEVNHLKDEIGGVLRYRPGEDGPLLRSSMNPSWYRNFWQINGRAPREGEYRDIAIERLVRGNQDTGEPPNEEFLSLLSELSRGQRLPEEWHGLTRSMREMEATGEPELRSLVSEMGNQRSELEALGLTRDFSRLNEVENSIRDRGRMMDKADFRQYEDVNFKRSADQDLAILQEAMTKRVGPFRIGKVELAPEALTRPDFKAAATIADKLGLRLVAFKGTGHRGMQSGRTVYLNKDMQDPLNYVFWHEVGHTMEVTHPEHYNRLMEIALEHIRDAEGLVKHYAEFGYGGEDIPHEFASDIWAEALSTPGFFAKVAEKSPELIRPLLEAIDNLITHIKSIVSKDDTVIPYLKDLETLRARIRQEVAEPYFSDAMGEKQFTETFGKQWQESAAKAKGEKTLLQKETELFAQQLDQWSNKSLRPDQPIPVCSTPAVLEKLGAPKLPVVIAQRTVEKVTFPKGQGVGKHGLSLDTLKKLPQQLHDPMIVFDSKTVPNSLVVVTELEHQGQTVVAAIHLSKRINRLVVNNIASVHPRTKDSQFIRWIDEGLLRYINNEKAQSWFMTRGLQLPKMRGTNGPSKVSILTEKDIVNLDGDATKPNFKLGSVGSSPIDDVKSMVEYAAGVMGKGNFSNFSRLIKKQFPDKFDGYAPEVADQLMKFIWGRAEEYKRTGETVLKFQGQETPLKRAEQVLSTSQPVMTLASGEGGLLEGIDLNPKNLRDISGRQAGWRDIWRNMRDVFGEKFPEVKARILDPLEDAKAAWVDHQRTLTDDLYDSVVEGLGIKKGSRESELVQIYGEGGYRHWEAAPKNTQAQQRWLSNLERKHGQGNVEWTGDGAYITKPYGYNDLVAEVGAERAADIVQAENWFRQKYDELLEQVNGVRAQIYPGQPERLVPKRNDYFHHFREMEGIEGIMNLFDTSAQISPELAGKSMYTRPKTKFAGFMQQRGMGKYKPDAVGGFLDYVPSATYAIHMDPQGATFRQLERELVKVMNGNTGLNKFIEYLQYYADDIQGKTNPTDRAWQFFTSRELFNGLVTLNNRIKGNMVLGNAGTMVSQVFNMPQGMAFTKQYSAPGLTRYISSAIKRAADPEAFAASDPMAQSRFLKERFSGDMYRRFATGIGEKAKNVAVVGMEDVDRFSTEFIWNACYEKGLKTKGVTDPIRYADYNTRRLVAGRGVGEVPLMQKSKIVQLVAPFQVEVGNLLNVIGDMRVDKDWFGAFIVLPLTLWLFNRGSEKVKGSSVALDPIQAIQDAIQIAQDETGEDKALRVFGRLAGEFLGNIPLGQSVAAMYPEYGFRAGDKQLPTRKEFFGREDPTRFGSGLLIAKGLQDPLYKMAMPWGGSQLQKTLKGIDAIENKGSYTDKGLLRYPVNTDPVNAAKGVVFGPSGFRETDPYYEANRRPLSENQTKEVEESNNRQRTYENIQRKRKIESLKGRIQDIRTNRNFTSEEKRNRIQPLERELRKVKAGN